MIKSIHIKGFKSHLDQTIELGLVNVFVGSNGSGKSNLLEAIGLASAAAWGQVSDQTLLYRGVRPGVEKLYKSGFKDVATPSTIDLTIRSETAKYSVGLYVPSGSDWDYKTETLYEGGSKKSGYSPSNVHRMPKGRGKAALERIKLKPEQASAQLIDTLAGFCIFEPNTHTLRNLVPDPNTREPVGLAGGRLAEAVEEVINLKGPGYKQIIQDIFGMVPWASAFGTRKPGQLLVSRSVATTGTMLGFKDRYLKDQQNWLSGYDASEGALYLLFTAVLLLHPMSPKFFAIDNADHGLNPRLVRRLFECICDWALTAADPRQMVLTTHNPLVLDGLKLQDDQIRLFTVDRDQHGHSVVNRVQIDATLLAKAEKQGLSLSRLWVMGQIGGVPNV